VGCDRCHDGLMFSDFDHHAEGVREHPLLAQPDAGDGRFRFRTPSLRNVALTAPYMHNGMLPTLRDVLRFYDNGRSENPSVSNQRDRDGDGDRRARDASGLARVSGQFRRVDDMSDGPSPHACPAACHREGSSAETRNHRVIVSAGRAGVYFGSARARVACSKS
jgi:hypothetical protein